MKDICLLQIESDNVSKVIMDFALLNDDPYAWLSSTIEFSLNNVFPMPEEIKTAEERLDWKLENWGCSSDLEELEYESYIIENHKLGLQMQFKTNGGVPYKVIDELIASHPYAKFMFHVYSEYSNIITVTVADSEMYVKYNITPKEPLYDSIRAKILSNDVFNTGRVDID